MHKNIICFIQCFMCLAKKKNTHDTIQIVHRNSLSSHCSLAIKYLFSIDS